MGKWNRASAVWTPGLAAVTVLLSAVTAEAQLCTTQAKLTPALRDTLAQTALELGSAVKAADVAALRAATVPSLAGNFSATEGLVRATGAELAGETLQVTQLYVLDATSRSGNDAGSADFSCPLANSAASETDFSINGLPAGRFSFAMVEATQGQHPWLLAFLLQQQTSGAGAAQESWKMAGFYPHPRTAGGHDGLWYWTEARARVAAKQPWLAWLEYGEADALLRPAAFVGSTHLDALHTEQHTAAPPGLAEGVSADSPVLVKDAEGGEFRITQLNAEATGMDGPLRLVLHVMGQAGSESAVLRARGTAAAQAFLSARPELRPAFAGMLVFVEKPGGGPEVLSLPME